MRRKGDRVAGGLGGGNDKPVNVPLVEMSPTSNRLPSDGCQLTLTSWRKAFIEDSLILKKHWKIRVLALRRRFLFLDLGKSGWGILLFTVIGVTLGWCYSASHGLSIVNDNAAVMTNISKVVVFLAVFVAVPITLIGSLVIDSLPRSEAEMLAAYNDTSLSPFVRIFAASQMRDYAVAKGADGWAVIWEQRRQEI